LDPFTSNLPVSTSKDWDALGYDPAYEGPTPSAGGAFPLVVLSPCWSCNNWEYIYIGARLASHGFVVAVTHHDRDWQWPWASGDNAVITMYHRTRDVSFALSQLLQKNDASGEQLHGVVDPSRIAMSGHQMGGYAAYALAGGDGKVCDALWPAHWNGDFPPYPPETCDPVALDPRVRAIVTLDGNSQLLRYDELARISVPSLILGETVEHTYSYASRPSPDPDLGLWMARPHAAINRGDSYRVDVGIANLFSYSSWCDGLKVMSNLDVVTIGTTSLDTYRSSWPCVVQDTFDPANNPATRQIVTTYMLAFLNTELGRKDDSGMLTSDYAAEHQPEVKFFDSEACSASSPGATEYVYRPQAGLCVLAERDPVGYFWEGPTSTPVPGFQIQDGGYVVVGTWWAGYAWTAGLTSAASGAGTTTITPANFPDVKAGATELCAHGSIGAASDYGGAAIIGVNVNQVPVPDASPSEQTVGIGGSGLTVQYTNPGGTQIRVQIQTLAGETSAAGRWCAILSGFGGTETVPWTAFWGGAAEGQGCWNAGGVSPPLGTQIMGVQLLVPGSNVVDVPYSFCLQGFAEAP
jgi:hypothetical protein